MIGGCRADDASVSGPGSGAGIGTATPRTLLVFAASSLTDAFGELAEAFERDHAGVTVEFNFAGSSVLGHQLQEGAPAEVFASADMNNMQKVVDSGDITAPPEIFTRNRLEIAVPSGNPGSVGGLDDFARAELLIGLCAEEVPCGRFGREALASAGVTAAIDTNEPDVRAVLTKIEQGELDAGIVYRTDVQSAGDAVEGIEIPDDQNVVADYPVAPLADAPDAELAADFVEFVRSDEAQVILAAYGFLAT